MAGLQGWQLVIIILIALLLFAAPKLPTMARNLGQSMRIFSSEVKQMRTEGKEEEPNNGSTAADPTEPVEGRVVDPDPRPRDDR
ncbi:twin-arginine translocase TatA/TatE family subunit [Micrococcus sp. EYE_162]|uniref:twin-arginine translocase TatA/TatE family subunit n=1 Tax=unclassified Micrococcus TaxID=2620948 RepID=UPI002005F871|nr:MULTISPECIES: twin-arginine translocase TatA/TatE family subunit [unclassified Micrococcus]MCK6094821.1 twin-arginine translocase TatA/TatE family subunit [Micrococcus sp. EYE_212]MCK6170768.1 twin-arginine translocase TatA/TatE family subunit [Micrococcus sp. EYE_162]